MLTTRKIISFKIEKMRVFYSDEIWKDGVRIYPKDDNFLRKLIRSGKPNMKVLAALIMDANKGENLKEYNSCKNDEDIAEKIKKDCGLQGFIQVK